MADAHKYRTVYHDNDWSPHAWAGNVAVRSIGGGCTCGWQGQPRPDTADGGVQAFNDWWTDHYTPLVRPDPGELLILSHTGGMRCHYLAGRPVPSGTTLELRLSGRRWVPVRYEWSARADAAPRFYMQLGGPWESFDEHGPETYVMLPLERTVFRWPVGNELDLLPPPSLEPMWGPGPDDAFRRSLTPPPPSSMTDSLEFSSGRGRRGYDQRDPEHGFAPAVASGNSFGRDLFAESMDFSSGRGRGGPDSLELPGSGRTYRLQPGPGGPPYDQRGERGMTDPFGFSGSGPVSGRSAPPGHYPGPPAPAIEPRRPAGPPPGMRPSAGDSFAGRIGGMPTGHSPFVDGQSWDGRRTGEHDPRPRDWRPVDRRPMDGRPMDGRPMDPRMLDGRPMDGRPMDRPMDGRPVDGRPMDGRPMDARSLDGRPMDGRPMDGRPMDGRPMDGPPRDARPMDLDRRPMRPPPGAMPELPPPGGDGPRRMRVGRPPSDFAGFPPDPGHPGMNGNGSHPASNGSGGVDGGAGSIQDQVSRIMREATDEARRATRPYPGGPPNDPGGHGHGHPRYQDYQGYPGYPGPEPMHGPGGEHGGPPEDPWRRPYDG